MGDMAATLGAFYHLREMLCDLLVANGCDCECDHNVEEHDDGCERCLACRIWMALDEAETTAAAGAGEDGGRHA